MTTSRSAAIHMALLDLKKKSDSGLVWSARPGLYKNNPDFLPHKYFVILAEVDGSFKSILKDYVSVMAGMGTAETDHVYYGFKKEPDGSTKFYRVLGRNNWFNALRNARGLSENAVYNDEFRVDILL